MMSLLSAITELLRRLLALSRGRDYPGISPQRLAKALVAEMKHRKRPTEAGFKVPAIYYIYLGQDDFYVVKPIEHEFISQLLVTLVEHIADARYIPDGKLDIVFELDCTFRRGQFAIFGEFDSHYEVEDTAKECVPVHGGVKRQEGHAEDLQTIEVSTGDGIIYEDFDDNVCASDIRQDTIKVGIKQGRNGFLRILKGSAAIEEFHLAGDSISVGRSSVCDLRLFDKAVSRMHAYIRLAGEGYIMSDFNSKNGTYVNGKRIIEVMLASGDEIMLGDTVLLFEER
jgi:hypothetical protein